MGGGGTCYVFGLRPSVSFCSAKHFNFVASLIFRKIYVTIDSSNNNSITDGSIIDRFCISSISKSPFMAIQTTQHLSDQVQLTKSLLLT